MFSFKTFEPHIKLQKWIKSYWIVDYKKINFNKIQEKIVIPYDNVCLLFVIDTSNSINSKKFTEDDSKIPLIRIRDVKREF